jgi:hypothetical protein
MPKQAKVSSAKSRSRSRTEAGGPSNEGGKHRPKRKDSKNDRTRKR